MAVESILGWMLQTIPDYRKENRSPSSKDATSLVMSALGSPTRSRADKSKDWRRDSRIQSVHDYNKQGYKRRSNGGENWRNGNFYYGSSNRPYLRSYQQIHRNRGKPPDGERNSYRYSLSSFKKLMTNTPLHIRVSIQTRSEWWGV